MNLYNTMTLSNGLRVIHQSSDSNVVYCGYELNVGTRNEEPGYEGMAHFCEHVSFKGTKRRKSWHISNALESVGGDLNAYTNKEDTVYYAAVLKEHTARAIDLLTDIVFYSTYPQAEIDKEVEVICDEIESYNDSPAELIYDEFENLLFANHALGHNILGTAERVRSFKTADAQRFTQRYYRPENSIFFLYGDVDFKRVVRLLERATSDFAPSKPIIEPALNQPLPPNMPDFIEKNHGTHQAHVMVGTRGYDIHDKRRMSLYLLNNLLGGPGMNARLNLSLRERHGLVYTVESSMVSYCDTGVWAIYFGCDPKDVGRCLKLVRKELDRVIQKPLSDTQLRAVKKQIKGQIGVACDNRESFALDFGKSYLHYGWERDLNSLFRHIDEVTAESMQQVAAELMQQERLTTLVID
ncbi:MAG: insulinase family protein [Prevotella salivae]|jgi:peptidase, M16 family|uniref:M16 family metallopeptidase n=1 Tax=Segatella salivae TaxID=228604 RepID=UPI001CB67031|nr:pitrilysin family protein [Segatella salivae]MBF1549414.1 insulinase family protein [Segatella salivae]MBF1561733.1 insulinase family protein [Segatella salivae]